MSDVDVVKLASANSLLPNMTICLEGGDDEKAVDVSYDDKEDDNVPSQDVKVQFKSNFPQTRIYQNKKFKELKELGLTAEEAKEKQESRAKRFDIAVVDNQMEVDEQDDKLVKEADELMSRLKQHNTTLSSDDLSFIRPNALHITGVDSMNTDEVFALFGQHLPRNIEWINDSSCNVVWEEEEKVARVLLQVTKPDIVEPEKETTEKTTEGSKVTDEDLDDLDLMDTNEADNISAVENVNTETKVEEKVAQEKVEITSELPLNHAREFNKDSKIFTLRFATNKDRKKVGSAQKSKFYLKHGNPHYGGMKGVLSASFRRRYQRKRTNNELMDMQVETGIIRNEKRRRHQGVMKYEREKTEDELLDEDLLNSSAKDLEGVVSIEDEEGMNKRSKISYGSMRADDEEKRPYQQHKKSALKSRLGPKNISATFASDDESVTARPATGDLREKLKNRRKQR